MTASGPAAPAARRVSARSRWAFGYGSIAYGVKDSGFATFLLLFYNQVIGLDAAAVGGVIGAVLIVEAFADPLVGFLSDHTRSRLGRRLPWMYGAALPISLAWLMLWNPPAGWSEPALLGYLFATALAVRLALSAFEIPSAAMGPELTGDYDERTRLFSYRYLFAWGGGMVMLALCYMVFLLPDPAHPRPGGYATMAGVGAVLMFGSIIASAIGLHPEIRNLPPAAPAGSETFAQHFGGFIRTVRNRGFLTLMAAGICAYTAQGISFGLSNYMYPFVWHFAGYDYLWLTFSLFLGAVGAFLIAPRFTRRGDKRRAGMLFAVANALLITGPYFLRLAGLFPLPGDPVTVPLLLVIFGLNTTCGVSAFIIGASMLSDVTEESEQRTGARSEGVFFAGSFFVQKFVGGLGSFMSGQILAIAQFPAAAKVGEVAPESIDRLTLVFALALLLFYGLAAVGYAWFPFGRAEHEQRLARLRSEAAEAAAAAE